MSGRPDEVYWFGVVDVKTGSICDRVMTGVQAGGAQQPCRRELLTYIRSTADVCTSTAVGHNEDQCLWSNHVLHCRTTNMKLEVHEAPTRDGTNNTKMRERLIPPPVTCAHHSHIYLFTTPYCYRYYSHVMVQCN